MTTPILAKQFFDQHSPDSGFFSKWRAQGPWSEKCLPIYEWEGVLFVGCLYPPADFPKMTAKTVFVLCDPESLKNIWYEYQGTVVELSTPLKPAPLHLDMPEGLSAMATASAPEAISMDSIANELGMNSDSPEQELSSDDAVLEETVPEISSSSDDDFLNVAPDLKPTPAENLYTKPGALSSQRPEITRISVKALQSTPKNNLDNFMQNIFAEMEAHFEKSMLFLKDGEEMKPWRWNGKFQMSSDEDSTHPGVQLTTPSPWRIVMRTQKPYHGHVIANDASDKFFDAWNNAQPPEHMTLVPVMIEDHVIGMLLGFGEKAADNKNSLHLAETLAGDIAKQIRAQPEFVRSA